MHPGPELHTELHSAVVLHNSEQQLFDELLKRLVVIDNLTLIDGKEHTCGGVEYTGILSVFCMLAAKCS